MPITPSQARRAYELRVSGMAWRRINETLGLTPNRTTATRQAATAYAVTNGLPTGSAFTATARSASAPRPRSAALTFGVEIELVGLYQDEAARVLRDAGIDARSEQYNHRTPTYWKVTYDASVGGGCEVVSPPLPFEDASFAIIENVTRALRNAGARINRSCGLHVHVGVRDLPRESIMNYADSYIERQASMDRLVSNSRRGSRNPLLSHWRGGVTGARWSTVRDEFMNGCRGWTRDDSRRYHTVNPFSFVKYGTLEFRQHQGTLSARKIRAWVEMLFALRTAAADGSTVASSNTRIASGLGFLGDLVDHGLSTRTAAYLTARADDLDAAA